jgi:hypothetical protein
MLGGWPGTTAAVGFAVSLVVHICTFFGQSLPHRFPIFWLLHVGIFVVFGPIVFVLKEAQSAGSLKRVFGSYPTSVIAAGVVLHLYVTLIGIASFRAMEGAVREQPSGYSIVNHGKFIRKISEAKFHEAQAVEARGFSAVWLSFYGLSALFWMFGQPEGVTRRP